MWYFKIISIKDSYDEVVQIDHLLEKLLARTYKLRVFFFLSYVLDFSSS